MIRNLTYYTGKLVCCTPKSEHVNILLETQTRTEVIKNGCRQTAEAQCHHGYNTWSVASKNFPQPLAKLLAHEQPAVFVLVKDDGVTMEVIVKVA